jgi:hypothetical protein
MRSASADWRAVEPRAPAPLVSVVMPVRRDDRVVRTVERLLAWAEARAIGIEMLIVGEPGTAGVPEAARWIERRPARKGRCVRDGVLASRGELVVVVDADLPVPDAALDAVVRALAATDVVFGNRWRPGTTLVPYAGWVRKTASWSFAALVRRLFGFPGVDTQCGLKAFRRAAAHRIFAGQALDGLAFDVEVVARAYELGFEPTNLRVEWQDKGDGTVSVWRAGPAMLLAVLWLNAVLWLRPGRAA